MIDHALETARLCDPESELEATFVPGAGMLCCSLRHRGDELLAQNAGVRAYAERGTTMGIPLLFPWANRLSAFDYGAAGRAVEVPRDPSLIAVDDHGLPIHGVIGGRIAWELTQPPGPDRGSLVARLSWGESRPELFAVFPFRHELEYRAQLRGGRLDIELAVAAEEGDAVPLVFGFHPYLSLPEIPRERWRVELPAMRHLRLGADAIPTGGDEAQPARRFTLAEEHFDDGFDAIVDPARFSVSGGGRQITLELLEAYPCAQVYSPRDAQFICFEPMTSPTNALRDGEGLQCLEPGGRRQARFSVHVEDLATGGPRA